MRNNDNYRRTNAWNDKNDRLSFPIKLLITLYSSCRSLKYSHSITCKGSGGWIRRTVPVDVVTSPNVNQYTRTNTLNNDELTLQFSSRTIVAPSAAMAPPSPFTACRSLNDEARRANILLYIPVLEVESKPSKSSRP